MGGYRPLSPIAKLATSTLKAGWRLADHPGCATASQSLNSHPLRHVKGIHAPAGPIANQRMLYTALSIFVVVFYAHTRIFLYCLNRWVCVTLRDLWSNRGTWAFVYVARLAPSHSLPITHTLHTHSIESLVDVPWENARKGSSQNTKSKKMAFFSYHLLEILLRIFFGKEARVRLNSRISN